MSKKENIGSLNIPGPLPKSERILAWSVWIFHSLTAFIISYWVSNQKLSSWIKHWLHDSRYMDGYKIDLADAEWAYYRETVNHLILDYSLNSLGLFLIKKYIKPPISHYAIIIIGFGLQIHMSSIKCVFVLYLFAFLVTCSTLLVRHSAVPWIMCILFITKASQYVPFSIGNHIFYREFNIYLYGAIKILCVCLHLCENPNIEYKSIFKLNILYYSYLPYSMTLIVVFENYCHQFKKWEQNQETTDFKKSICFGFRLLFWFAFFEFLLHFLYVNALFNSPFTIINSLNIYEACSVAYVAGQFFHLKYVIIFGVPAFFASLDGMIPPPPPICISRVSLYSRMWRYFDNGLYQFLKYHVYIPVMRKPLPPLLSILRNLGALCAVFGVVLAWHGTRRHYICWVSLSALELIIERVGWSIWKTNVIQEYRRNISDNCCRRIIATLMLCTVTPGIFGVFFFLGQEGVGETIFKNVVVNGVYDVLTGTLNIFPLSTGFGFLHILTLGYFFNNVCLDIEFLKRNKEHSS